MGTRVADELYGGVDELHARLVATGIVLITVRIAGLLLADPTELVTVTVNCELLSPITVAGVV